MTSTTAQTDEIHAITRAQRGDQQAYKELFEQYFVGIFLFLLKLCGGDRHRAEDIAMETLERAFSRIHIFKADGQSIAPWLVTVARRIAIDGHRARTSRPAETYDRNLDAGDVNRFAALSAAETEDCTLNGMVVREAMRLLSVSHREILVEVYLRGRTVPEAAKKLNLPLGTAKSRVYYALRALRNNPVLAEAFGTSAGAPG